ncbi:Peptidase propeptide and YPEB domain-containing protein [Myxococcus fulvus]|uniref:Peptidase propeptide and YPEB domain-containing protein n=2 Tax=Myxococcus fulvus TaxID=33 RepID=A0A511TFC1_MYXFU|nr:PepSY domain-containing protein [Myxococcus fulvus]GEN12860.1 hypothetical protein MFU01_78970 [Myxococcus fulvus]SET87905.1 Peptidase propeptide and YPEB domain-containing protein [Myxococcus fulvus]
MRSVVKAAVCMAVMATSQAWGFNPTDNSPKGALASQAFFKPELSLASGQVPLSEALPKLGPDSKKVWDDFFARNGNNFEIYIDVVTGTAANIQGAVPLIPGNGVGNKLTLGSLGRQLGRSVDKVDGAVVADLVFKFVEANRAAVGVDMLQLGEARADQINPDLWQVSIPQQYQGIPVRYGRLAATISHGNLILLGTESWANVGVSPMPLVDAEKATVLAHERFGLYESPEGIWKEPTLEVTPVSVPNAGFAKGMTHQLVWTYGFTTTEGHEHWKVTVDAATGDVLALEDDNHYIDQSVRGGAYVFTNTGVPATCTPGSFCGSHQPNYPMPWANTGLASPNNFTDGYGVFDYTAGTTATTTLNGRYIRLVDTCGTLSASGAGNINLGNGTVTCPTPTSGNTAATRSAFYELNRIKELARGWLPTNTWLQASMTANVNINSTCNAFWNGSTVNFYRSGGGCRNTGEIAAVFDHEWGHGMDDNDTAGTLSNSSEAYADIASMYRLPFNPSATPTSGQSPASCVGYGFFQTTNNGCGMTADGTGYNVNEAQTGGAWCATNCSGVRDADYAAHNPATPTTPQNFVCTRCSSGTGPCSRQVHCAASPVRQAAWDFIARDLRSAPFNYDWNTAQNIGNKVFYQGSGNIGSWHACNCTAGTSDGCAATNGYKQWLAADDDNGNINDGTPHMTAIYNAFNRHNIACATPAPVNSGCSGGPTAAPTVTVTPATGQVSLSWSAVSGATQYWVMKSDGVNGCQYGKARVATTTATNYVDGEVLSGHNTCYSIVAAGSSAACYGAASTCTCVSPL